ncbi:hypothetical protein F5Y19DRAFT_463039 [Xylariaceae sp. FL1651]|nr:hypothetical protein F5Y19DRAFT_463039 [Xylariaceae sp. FL1651]
MSKPGPMGRSLLSCITAFTITCTGFLLLRLWAARLTKRHFSIDDAFALVAFASTLACEGTIIWAIYNGFGKPSNSVPLEELVVQTKLSMLTLYLRLFTMVQFKKYIYGLISIVSIYGFTFIVVILTNCNPIHQLWDPVPGGWCQDVTIEQFTIIGFNLVIDLAIVIFPMPILWQLQMPRHSKIFVTMMFSIGLVTVVVMAWRLNITTRSARTTDFFLLLPEIGLASQLELWLGLIVVCMPTLGSLIQAGLKPVFVRLKLKTSSRFRASPRKPNTISGNNTDTGQQYYGISRAHGALEMPGHAFTITECTYDPTAGLTDTELKNYPGIYVQRDVESQSV